MLYSKNAFGSKGFSLVGIATITVLLSTIVAMSLFVLTHNSRSVTGGVNKVNDTVRALTIKEWGITGDIEGKYIDIKYVLGSGGDVQLSSAQFASDFKATKCKIDCLSEPLPYRIVRTATPPDADPYGTKETPDQISAALSTKKLILADGWYYYLPTTGPTYGSELACSLDNKSTIEKPTCDIINSYNSQLDYFFRSLRKIAL
jgi:hypothetical protein